MCVYLPALDPILPLSPPSVIKYILKQYAKILPHDPPARRIFVETGALRKVQELEAEPGSEMLDIVIAINKCFPEEVVRYYSPDYPQTLLDRVEQYCPAEEEEAEAEQQKELVNPTEKSGSKGSKGKGPQPSNSSKKQVSLGETAILPV